MSDEPSDGGSSAGAGDGAGGGRAKKPAPRVVPLPLKREINAGHLANLRASGLSDDTIRLAELWTEPHDRVLSQMLGRSYPRMCLAALVFPFYLPGASEPHGYRIRPTNARSEKRRGKLRLVKYDQAEGLGVIVYFPPRARCGGWYAGVGAELGAAATLYWTEGEKKALVLDQLGLTCVGLTGVWNWLDVPHKRSTGGERLHAAIREHVTVAGRAHVIVFDADATENEQVMMAAQRLCGALLTAGATSVRFVCPPPGGELKGIDDYYAAHGEPATRGLLDAAAPIEPADPKNPLVRVRAIKALRDAPVANDLRVPEGYEIHKDGSLWRLAQDDKHSDTQIAFRVMLPQRFLIDLYGQELRVELCYPRGDRWEARCVPWPTVVDSRTMVAELSLYGAPVTSNTASKWVDWFEAMFRANEEQLPHVVSVARVGWHRVQGERVFVLHEPVAHEGSGSALAVDTRGDRRAMFGALRPRGSLAGHLDALRIAWAADPVCAAMICGALAATLLEPLGAPNFAISLSGDSSRGKTSMLKIAGSVFGNPNDPQWITQWSITFAGAEQRAATLSDLPLLFDEAGGEDAEHVEQVLYMLINGVGRTRSTRDLQLRETNSWRTIVLSTGERGLADETAATGAQVRVIQMPVGSFGALGGPAVDALREACAQNSGSFGRRWIEWIISIEDWAPFRQQLTEQTQLYRERAQDPLQGRIAQYYALLTVAEQLAAQIGLGDVDGATMNALFGDLDKREAVDSLADRSRQLVEDWVLSEPDAFPDLEMDGMGDESEPAPRGRIVRQGFRRVDGTLLIIPGKFRDFCHTHRLSSREVLREWQQRGWTVFEHRHLSKKVKLSRGRWRRLVHLLPPADPEAE